MQVYVPDPKARFRLQAGIDGEFRHIENTSVIRTNSLGLRGGEIEEKVDGEVRILGLGDSFGFGFSVSEEEGMFGRLEAMLNAEDTERNWTVLNGAVPGYSVAQGLALCRDLLPKVDPDYLLVVIFVGNDFFDSDPDRLSRMTAQDGMIVFQDDDDPAGPALVAPFRPVLLWMHFHSHLFRFLRRILNSVITRWGLTLVEDADIYLAQYPEGSRYVAGTDAMFDAVAGFKELADRDSLRLSFVVVPTVTQIRPERWEFFLKRHDLQRDDLVRTKPQERIRGFLDSLGVPYLDLLPYFEEADAEQPLYYKVDPHLNSRGHEVAGRLLVGQIAEVIK